jgi:catechol-2,3-dioxygenase
VSDAIRIRRARLTVAEHRLDEMQRFYLDRLGLAGAGRDDRLDLSVGSAELCFDAATADVEPFYHFALLVPGNRYAAAHEWLGAQVPLLAHPDDGRTVFEFDFWDAQAAYMHDPASNIVELIAHHGIDESPETHEFTAAELTGISEVGIVTADLPAAASQLEEVGLELWSGAVSGEGAALGFVGRRSQTLILCRPGRPWLPTGRAAESHPLEVVVATGENADVVVRARDASSLEVTRGCRPKTQ